MSHNYFITATGTDIGKTFVTCQMLRYLRCCGKEARAAKPVMSGVDDLYQNDAVSLLHSMQREVTKQAIESICPWQYSAPLSPHRAAELEGRILPYDQLVEWSLDWLGQGDKQVVSLIEGAGGIMVPLTRQHTMLDWMQALHLPVILVTGHYLGTLSHTLTALHCLKAAAINVAAIVVNASEHGVQPEDTVHTIRGFSPVEAPVFFLPRLDTDQKALWESNAWQKEMDLWEACKDFFSFVRQL